MNLGSYSLYLWETALKLNSTADDTDTCMSQIRYISHVKTSFFFLNEVETALIRHATLRSPELTKN